MSGSRNLCFLLPVCSKALICESIKDRYGLHIALFLDTSVAGYTQINLRFVSDTILDPFSRYCIFTHDQSGRVIGMFVYNHITILSLPRICSVILKHPVYVGKITEYFLMYYYRILNFTQIYMQFVQNFLIKSVKYNTHCQIQKVVMHIDN